MWALTIWQPWASLIVAGAKPFEFRSWQPHPRYHGQRIALHASTHLISATEARGLLTRLCSPNAWMTCLKPDIAIPVLERFVGDRTSLPRGAIVGTAVLSAAIDGWDAAGAMRGTPINDSERVEHSNFAWPLSDIRAQRPIVPMRGQQGFWWWEGRA